MDHEDGKKDPYIKKPDKLSYSKCVSWEEAVYTYFTDMRNSQGVPLVYFIQKTPAPSGIFIDGEQEIVLNFPL